MPARDLRRSLLDTAVVIGLVATFGAEALSLFRALTPAGAAILWVTAAGIGAVIFLHGRARVRAIPPATSIEAGDRALLGGVAVLALVLAATALAAAPNNWDSLTYHLPRVRHWIEDRSLAPYPTSILRQLTLPPGAELLLMHLGLLSGSDRLFPLLQWAAWAGCVVAASSVAGRLGAGRSGQIAAAVFGATLPMAILQASSTQNDLVASFWLLAFADAVLRLAGTPIGARDVVLVGGSLGLALLTKATSYLFALPFVVWLAVSLLRRERGRALLPLAGIAAVALAVNLGYFARNRSLFGSPFGESYGALAEIHSPAAAISGVSRNAALHFSAPSPAWNRAVEEGIGAVHRAIGLASDDPRTTWKGAEFHVPPGLRGAGRPDPEEVLFLMLHEDSAGSPLHAILIAVAAGAAFASRRRNPRPIFFLAAVAAASFLFCFALKWQPWNARLQLPLFFLAAPAAAAALVRPAAPSATRLASGLLLAASLPWIVLNATRPLVGPESVFVAPRLAQYFAARPGLEKPLESAGSAVGSLRCRDVGIEIGPDDPEYLLWVVLGEAVSGPRLEHVGVRNRSAVLERQAPFVVFRPCAVVSLAPASAPEEPGALRTETWDGGRVTVRRP